jgi:hypothetical protein
MSQETSGERPEGSPAAAVSQGHHREIHFAVDGEPYETEKREWTPNQIIAEFGHKDPKTHYLVRLERHHPPISYQGQGDELIEMHDGMRFQIISTGPTPVS